MKKNTLTMEKIWEKAAVSLSKMERPDFSNDNEERVFEAFRAVFDGYHVHDWWFEKFAEQISKLSKGEVRLIKADKKTIKTFKTRVLGPAVYLVLIKGDTEQKLLFGPYSNPVSFSG